jgi:hypothetical protein
VTRSGYDAIEPARAAGARSTHWIVALLVIAPLLVAAFVGLPLFQDGSSYLLELMTSHSAVRHYRYSVLLVQAPSIVALKLSALADLDPRSALTVVRGVFSFSYAILPFVALAWSWLLVRQRDPAMMLWPVAAILLLNVVNFSGVSEILLAAQLAFPLLLAASQRQPTRFANTTILVLVPVILLLHALVAVLYAGLACGMALRARRLSERDASRAWILAAVFGGAVLVRLGLNAWLATDYERGMWGGSALVEYFRAQYETTCFLAIATGSTLWFGLHRHGLARAVVVVSMVFAVLACGTVLRNLSGIRGFHEQPSPVLALLYVTLIAMAVHAIRRPAASPQVSSADRAVFVLLWSAAAAVISRYTLLESFPLKTGATVLIAAALLVFAAFDSTHDHPPFDVRRRELFVLNAAAVFAALLLSKAAIWDVATTRLARALAASTTSCVEIDDTALDWVRRSPGAILNNWSLPTLGLVSAPLRPPVLLLEAGDCERFTRSGEIVVDPWTVLTPRQLPFVVGKDPDARDE